MSTNGKGTKSLAGLFERISLPRPTFIAYVVGMIGIAGGVFLPGCSALLKTEPRQAPQAAVETDSITAFRREVTNPAPTTEVPDAKEPTLDPVHGRALFSSLGCADCHGEHAEGMGGEHADDEMTVPTLAQTRLSLQRLIEQVRHPHDYMRSYGVTDVSDADLAAIYAYLQTLPAPARVVPSVLNQVPSAPTGTIRGTVYYAGTRTPVPDFDLYLITAEITDGKPHYVYDTWFQPTTTTNTDGMFEMPLIREGYYVLFESRKMQEMASQNGNVALVYVVAGQTTDLEVFVPR
ncbi:MAG: c-type cytochrome [Anaerolineae bacterium]